MENVNTNESGNIIKRDKAGRWKKGVSGNPIGCRRSENTLAAVKAIPVTKVKALVTKWYDMAMNGDTKAGKLLADLLFHKPTQQIELLPQETIFERLGLKK